MAFGVQLVKMVWCVVVARLVCVPVCCVAAAAAEEINEHEREKDGRM